MSRDPELDGLSIDDRTIVRDEAGPILRPIDPANPPKLGREQIMRHRVIPPPANISIPVGILGELPDEELVLVNRKDRRRRRKR